MCPVDQSKRAAEGLGGRKARKSIKSKTMANLELDKNLEMSVMPRYDGKVSQIWLYLRSRLLRPSQANVGILAPSQKRD
jgi:hypothetical protein